MSVSCAVLLMAGAAFLVAGTAAPSSADRFFCLATRYFYNLSKSIPCRKLKEREELPLSPPYLGCFKNTRTIRAN